ncbi:hypothetical protein TWF696_002653 [Orbilia brochopaga]|uniref:Uncharacterized protein n=1 Tax=Orbilia brochopaga TaxID=3140254 RepID=A0AAV9U450_9PEZI
MHVSIATPPDPLTSIYRPGVHAVAVSGTPNRLADTLYSPVRDSNSRKSRQAVGYHIKSAN